MKLGYCVLVLGLSAAPALADSAVDELWISLNKVDVSRECVDHFKKKMGDPDSLRLGDPGDKRIYVTRSGLTGEVKLPVRWRNEMGGMVLRCMGCSYQRKDDKWKFVISYPLNAKCLP